jgi:WD repeat-containing protein 35
MNQTLEGHNGTVMCLAWNPAYKKLTTSDEKGLIIVWVLHKGMWYEEMINNRNKSVVMDMKWTSDGKKICIIYEDGAVIVGSVDGNRLWGKELNLPLRRVEWSPDSRFIIFITQESEAFIFDSEGSKIRTMSLAALQTMESSSASGGGVEDVSIVGIDWYCSSLRFTRSTMSDGGQYLCIAFDNGIAQISRGDDDNDPIIFDTELGIKSCKWSPDGAVIAFIGGQYKSSSSYKKSSKEAETRTTNYIKFYSASGLFLRQVRIPGDEINSITWESSGLRIGLAVDAFIFFANVRMTYLWAYLQNTVIYSYYRPERKESVVIFWDLTSGETFLKYVPQLEFLVASGDHCALVLCDAPQGGGGGGSGGGGRRSQRYSTGGPSDEYCVQLRNSVGAIVHTRRLPFQPKYVSMGANHLTVANDRTVYVWQFQMNNSFGSTPLPSSSSSALSSAAATTPDAQYLSGRNSQSKERIFDIETIAYSQVQPLETFKISTEAVMNPITCVTISDKYLMIGRKAGSITRFTLPHLSAENEYFTGTGGSGGAGGGGGSGGGGEPFRIELSCHSTKLGVIDASGVFTIIDLDARPAPQTTSPDSNNFDPERSLEDGEGKSSGPGGPNGGGSGAESKGAGQRLKVERRDVWDMKWAEDNDEMVCVMEKTKLQVFRGEVAEEPITASGFLCRFQNLEVRSVILDEILKQPIEQQPQPPSRDLVVDFESKSLREVREKMTNEGLAAGYQAAERSPHPRLFRLIAESALEALDLTTAEKSFVKCSDYHAIQLVRQLREMMSGDKMKARAEVAVYLKKYDDAEALYREIDRKDLAIQMRKRICDYPRVVQLLQTGGGNDQLMREAWDKIAEQYADRFKWKKAAQYFKQSRNIERLADCLYRLEMFQELAELRVDVPDGTPLLHSLAVKFANLGMHEEAVDCYLRYPPPPPSTMPLP